MLTKGGKYEFSDKFKGSARQKGFQMAVSFVLFFLGASSATCLAHSRGREELRSITKTEFRGLEGGVIFAFAGLASVTNVIRRDLEDYHIALVIEKIIARHVNDLLRRGRHGKVTVDQES
ncbi:uncharacterized protein PV09_09724 [Verruconis gallopava]|uniref:Uncharacterized protein n=1 Tax=Verruconis gallopava TaxID=253628 RepID=A0A0D1ZVG0_9PEZI|nr:uncharacterized protein PV09_09724 [Verruconis gallopava]KIV98457.1 hypothetical protein PV09_09724 [Verruconis gallopava]